MDGTMSTQDNCQIRELTTVDAVIDALGGNVAVQDLTKAKSLQTVTNWRYSHRIASHYYVIMTTALEAMGCTAPPEIWGIKSASEALEAAAG
jgi:hypothetical protein